MPQGNKPKLQERLEAGVRSNRAYREAEHLFAQTAARTIFRTLLLVAVDYVITVGLVLLADLPLAYLLPAPPCLRDCWSRAAISCCSLDPHLWTRAAAAAVMIAIGSFLSTRGASARVFQHSALLNVFVLLTLGCLMLGTPLPLWQRGVFLGAAFLAVFLGFKAGLAARRRMRSD